MTDIDDLLLDWEDRRDRGEAVAARDLCAAAPHLTAEVTRRIGLLERCDRLLAPPADDTRPAGDADGPVPTAVAGYEVLGLLGRGGTGVVYKARDPVLCRDVAVKTLRPVLPADRQAAADRFGREGRVLARLRHEAVVPIFEARVHDGVPCLVMEYEPGGSVADHRARLTAAGPAAVVALVGRAARAVAYVHRQGVLHRDLKPANLLLDADGRVRVSDFGLAKLIAPDDPAPPEGVADDTTAAAPAAALTAPGRQPGTWAYMAPEQYDPAVGPVGPATDVWALGVILHELLTGRRPFAGADWGEMRAQVCGGRVPSAPRVPRRLRRVVARCLTRDPARRFRTADDLADALTAAVSWRRWGAAVAAAAAVAAGLTAGYVSRPPPPERPDVSRPPPPEWPDVPAVRDLHSRLDRGEPVELIGDHGPPAAFAWATGLGSGRVMSAGAEPFRVVSMSPVGCLVELLPALPPGRRYRVTGELLHDIGNGVSWVGVYAGRSHCDIDRGRQHFLLTTRFTDRGSSAESRPENNTVLANRRTHFAAQYMGDGGRDPMAGRVIPAPHPGGRLVPPPAVGWRRLSLTIDATGAASSQADDDVGGMSVAAAEQSLAAVRRRYPDLPRDGELVRPYGGVGLYVFNGSLAARSVSVTPLPPGE